MRGEYVRLRHRCEPPAVRGSGDIWRCTCGRLWRSRSPGNPDFDRWARVTRLGALLRGIR